MTGGSIFSALPAEIAVLGLSAALLLGQVLMQAVALDLVGGLGFRYLLGPRDEGHAPNGVLVGRLLRATRNFLETYPAFIALALILVVAGKTGGFGAVGAWLWLIARVVYVGFYAAGVSVLRTLAWLASIVGLLLMLFRVVL